MTKTRVLLVDDSAVVRRLIAAALVKATDLDVVGTAPDGQAALDRLAELRPDVVLLDLEMPVLDGLQTLVALRKAHPRLPVIMFSRFTQKGVEATVHALTLGADDYVPKPGDGLEVGTCVEQLLIPKIRLLATKSATREQPALPVARTPAPPSRLGLQRVDVVAIGTSTGGPNALAEVFTAFPAAWSVPIVLVQHMPPEFTTRLAERLTDKSKLTIREAKDGDPLDAAQAWVAPGNYHLTLKRENRAVRLALNQDPPVNSCRPAVDVLFRSAAELYGPGVLAVVLTGMGQDGLRGCEAVRAAGGQVIVQDQVTSVVWSMPGAVAQAGLAHQVLPLDRVGPEIVRRAGHPR